MDRARKRTERHARRHTSLTPRLFAVAGVLACLFVLVATRQADAATARALVAATVTVEQASGQSDPTNAGPIAFTATFNQSVTGFEAADVTLGGTAGPTTAAVTGGPSVYTINVTGMTGSGTVTASIGANKVAGDGNAASTSSDNTVTYDATRPDVAIDQGPSQVDPTTVSPVVFRAVFSETVTGFSDGDVTVEGTSGANAATVSGSGTTYTISVTGMTQSGSVIAKIAGNKVTDLAGNQNQASTSTDNTVTWAADTTKPTVTVEQASGQVDPTSATPVRFTAVFSEPVSGFADGDVTVEGTSGANTASVSGSGTTYTISVTGMTQTGTVIAKIGANKVADANGNGNVASTSTDNTVTYAFTTTRPTVTINQASGQADPTSASPIVFTAVFSRAVTGFAGGDVGLSGTANPGSATVSGIGTTYTISVSGMTQTGTVIATIPANVVTASGGDQNFASTSTDNTVTYQSATTVTYTGDRTVGVGGKLNLAARLTTVLVRPGLPQR